MSLRSKIVIILFAVVVMYAALDRVIQEVVVFKSFAALEEVEAERDLQRVVEAIRSEVRHLSVRCDDWATWDDTYRFIEDTRLSTADSSADARRHSEERAKQYIVSNLVPESFHKNNLNLLYIVDEDGRVVWGRSLDLRGDRDFVLHDFPSERLAPDHPLLSHGANVFLQNLPRTFTSKDVLNLFVPFGPVVAVALGADASTDRTLGSASVRLQNSADARKAIDGLGGKVVDGREIRVKENEIRGGLLMTERGPMLISAKRILDSHRHGPARGTVIMGRLLSQALVTALASQTGVDFHVWRVEGDDLPEEERKVLNEVTAQSGDDCHVIRAADEDTLHAYTTFGDIREAPALLIRAEIARDITARGATAARYALLSTAVAGILILSVLLHLLQRTVLKPIAVLTEQASAIGKSEDFTRKLNFQRNDEIGVLSREFDSMVEKLAESRAALVKAARAAGMSEVATGVLHNVGNVLNSVNVSATLVADNAKSAGLADLKLALKTVEESTGDLLTFISQDPRGKHLYPLLISLAAELERERDTIAREAKMLTSGIDHIKELIQSQQSYTGRAGVLELVSLADEIDAALGIAGPSLYGCDIEIVREFDQVPARSVDRHRLKEVLVNLIQNARQAMQSETPSDNSSVASDAVGAARARGDHKPRLTLRLKNETEGRVRIEVEDNGIGIPHANLSLIFTHGFTTKKNGHGFGLHTSANAATEMGGSLTVTSDGPGRGATFILELPIEKAHGAGTRS